MKSSSKAGERRSAAQMHALAAVRREIVLRDSCNRRKYLREYTQAFRKYDTVLSNEQLTQKIAAADILLIGDYHALPASQRFVTTLIEQISVTRHVVLCVEAILSRDQTILDSWWRREISEQELRKRLRFDREWGYDWQPFFELLSCARDHADAICGIDCMPREDMRRIRSRDRHAAAKVCEARSQHPNAAILVLFGESHMAPEHLPRLIKEASPADSALIILQNVDALYWQAIGENAPAVSTGPDSVCVFNSSPLEKYESYRLCLERWNSDDQTDFAPAIYNVIFSLARTLGFRLDSPHNGTQPKYLADSLPEIVNVCELENKPCDSGTLPREVLEQIEESGCCYVADTNQIFVREFNMQNVAAESARFLRRVCRGMNRDDSSPIDAALAHFGARLLSPGTPALEQELDSQGEKIYQAYVEGRITRAAIRRLFLGNNAEAGAILSSLWA
jgi:heme-binding uptake protein ChaN (Tiki superfamily)